MEVVVVVMIWGMGHGVWRMGVVWCVVCGVGEHASEKGAGDG